jgi:hypothetical protein
MIGTIAKIVLAEEELPGSRDVDRRRRIAATTWRRDYLREGLRSPGPDS